MQILATSGFAAASSLTDSGQGWPQRSFGPSANPQSYPGEFGVRPPERGGWQPPARLRGTERSDYYLIGGGELLFALPTMLPWVTMTLVGSFNLLHFTSATNSVMLVPWAMVIADLGLRATGFAGAHLTGLSRLAGIIVVLTALVDGGDFFVSVRLPSVSPNSNSISVPPPLRSCSPSAPCESIAATESAPPPWSLPAQRHHLPAT